MIQVDVKFQLFEVVKAFTQIINTIIKVVNVFTQIINSLIGVVNVFTQIINQLIGVVNAPILLSQIGNDPSSYVFSHFFFRNVFSHNGKFNKYLFVFHT